MSTYLLAYDEARAPQRRRVHRWRAYGNGWSYRALCGATTVPGEALVTHEKLIKDIPHCKRCERGER